MSSRTSVCRMSSKDKMNVQDQSKERGVSGGLEASEEKESSPGKPAAVFEQKYYMLCKCDHTDYKRCSFSYPRKLHHVQSRHWECDHIDSQPCRQGTNHTAQSSMSHRSFLYQLSTFLYTFVCWIHFDVFKKATRRIDFLFLLPCWIFTKYYLHSIELDGLVLYTTLHY